MDIDGFLVLCLVLFSATTCIALHQTFFPFVCCSSFSVVVWIASNSLIFNKNSHFDVDNCQRTTTDGNRFLLGVVALFWLST
jgi:hypothetical protein